MPDASPNDRDERTVDRLAAEYLDRVAREGHVDADEYLRRLESEAERTEFVQLVADAARVSDLLPRALTEGAVLAERYRLDGVLGAGGMGKVFAAWDAKLERTVALKVMHAFGAGETPRAELFQRESRLLAALQHPGIVAVHEIAHDRTHDVHYIVMDRIDGVPLDRLLERVRARHAAGEILGAQLFDDALGRPAAAGRPSLLHGGWWECVARVGAEIARTLEAAHERGVVHRDLKPSNVLLCGGGHPVLLDFGLAALRGATAPSDGAPFCGSLPYLAPEQARTLEAGDDPQSDVFQAGLVLYEFVALRRAYDASEFDALLEQVRRGAIVPAREQNAAIPVELAAIVHGALAEDRKLRYASARALREDLELFLAGLPPKALTSHRWRRLWKRTLHSTRRRPLIAGTLVAAVFASGVFGAWYAVEASRWTAPIPQFVRVHGDGMEALNENGDVAPSDHVGAQLDCEKPVVVYALERWERDGEIYLRPTVPSAFVGPARAEKRGDPTNAALELPPGNHLVMLQSIDDDAPRKVGVCLVLARHPQPLVEDWIAELHARIEDEDEGVPLADALRMNEALANMVARGGPERAFDDPATRANVSKALAKWFDDNPPPDNDADLVARQLWFQVRR